MFKRPSYYGKEDDAEALHTQAILASYGWLLPQACYQGKLLYSEHIVSYFRKTWKCMTLLIAKLRWTIVKPVCLKFHLCFENVIEI